MKLLLWLESVALTLTGTKRCNTQDKLLAYMRGKDIYALHHWVESRMWYHKDGTQPWRQNWTPIEEVLSRDIPGSDIESDCEERGVVKKFVINRLGWGVAENLVVWADDTKRPDGSTWCHAACVAWKGTRVFLLDYKVEICGGVIEAVAAMGRAHKVKPTRYCFCNDKGATVSEVFNYA